MLNIILTALYICGALGFAAFVIGLILCDEAALAEIARRDD